jgi:hypothetical protein
MQLKQMKTSESLRNSKLYTKRQKNIGQYLVSSSADRMLTMFLDLVQQFSFLPDGLPKFPELS